MVHASGKLDMQRVVDLMILIDCNDYILDF